MGATKLLLWLSEANKSHTTSSSRWDRSIVRLTAPFMHNEATWLQCNAGTPLVPVSCPAFTAEAYTTGTFKFPVSVRVPAGPVEPTSRCPLLFSATQKDVDGQPTETQRNIFTTLCNQTTNRAPLLHHVANCRRLVKLCCCCWFVRKLRLSVQIKNRKEWHIIIQSQWTLLVNE